jgi:hypothetical protein
MVPPDPENGVSTAPHRKIIHIDMDAAAIDGYRFAQPDLRAGNMTHRLTLVPAIGRKA